MIQASKETRNPQDVDLQARVRLSLAMRNRVSLRTLRVEVVDSIATLSGRVPQFYDRLLAVETVRRVAGVRAVRDEITVASSESPATLEPPTRPFAPIEVGSRNEVGVLAHRATSSALVSWFTVMASFVVAAMCGCGAAEGERVQVFPVTGLITQGGKPLAGAQVVFHPKNPADSRTPVAQGRTDEAGKYQLTSYETNDGAAAGEYAVTVQYYPLIKNGESFSPGPNVLPPKLATPETTDLKATVAAAPTEVPPIEVKK